MKTGRKKILTDKTFSLFSVKETQNITKYVILLEGGYI